MIIIKEANNNGAWWYKTPEDAYKDLQNSFIIESLPTRYYFIEAMDNFIVLYIEDYEVFNAYEGDQ